MVFVCLYSIIRAFLGHKIADPSFLLFILTHYLSKLKFIAAYTMNWSAIWIWRWRLWVNQYEKKNHFAFQRWPNRILCSSFAVCLTYDPFSLFSNRFFVGLLLHCYEYKWNSCEIKSEFMCGMAIASCPPDYLALCITFTRLQMFVATLPCVVFVSYVEFLTEYNCTIFIIEIEFLCCHFATQNVHHSWWRTIF